MLRFSLLMLALLLTFSLNAQNRRRTVRSSESTSTPKSMEASPQVRTGGTVFSYQKSWGNENDLQFRFNPADGASSATLSIRVLRTNSEKSVTRLPINSVNLKYSGGSLNFIKQASPSCDENEEVFELGSGELDAILNGDGGGGLMVLVLDDGGGEDAVTAGDFIYELRFGSETFTYNPSGLTVSAADCDSYEGEHGHH